MERSQCYIGAPNGVVACVDCLEKREIAGRLYHGYRPDAYLFRNAGQMLGEMEELFDDIKFPHPSTDRRTFAGGEQGIAVKQERTRTMSDEELLGRHGDLGTFIIRVQHRQNSSWQGSITWADQNKTVYFRSIWEMIKLIESAVDTVSGPEEDRDMKWPGLEEKNPDGEKE